MNQCLNNQVLSILNTTMVLMTVRVETIVFLCKTLTKHQVKVDPLKKTSHTPFTLRQNSMDNSAFSGSVKALTDP